VLLIAVLWMDGVDEDRYGPVVLALMLGLLIATNFAMKIYSYSSWAQQY
jgi:hypothetical protein